MKKLQKCDKIIIEEDYYKKVISLGVFIEMYQAEQELKKYNCVGKVTSAGYYVSREIQEGKVSPCVFQKYKIQFLRKFADKPPVNRGDRIYLSNTNHKGDSYVLTIEKIQAGHVIASIEDEDK